MQGYAASVEGQDGDFYFASLEDVEERCCLPTAFRAYKKQFPKLQQRMTAPTDEKK